MDKRSENNQENPYLELGFWEFAIMSTLMTVFFPWSLLFCAIFYGLTETKNIIVAMIHDTLRTIGAVLSILLALMVFGSLIFGLISKAVDMLH